MAAESKPISLYPLTPEEALRRAMRAPVPKNAAEQPPEKRAARALPKAKKKATRKKG